MTEEKRLPKKILEKSIKSENEYGWRQTDAFEIFEAVGQIPMAIIGGQIQYCFPDGTCELYWLSYDSTPRRINEDWKTYCERTIIESKEKFQKLVELTDFKKEAMSFDFLKKKIDSGIDIENYKVFLFYFDDKETDLHART